MPFGSTQLSPKELCAIGVHCTWPIARDVVQIVSMATPVGASVCIIAYAEAGGFLVFRRQVMKAAPSRLNSLVLPSAQHGLHLDGALALQAAVAAAFDFHQLLDEVSDLCAVLGL